LCYILIILTKLLFFKAKQSTCQSFKHDGGVFVEMRQGNILMSIQIYLTDFKAKWIKSKINKYKINNTKTKHEFKVKYEGY